MTSYPIITIGFCVKNDEATIKKAIESILIQDFPHERMEIIVVDGQSQDKTLVIIEKALSETDINKRVFTENRGLGFARQMVVDNAKGNYIVWVDGDVILSKSYIKKQIAFMERNPLAAIIVGTFGICREDNWIATLENISYVIGHLRLRGRTTSNLIGTAGAVYRVKAIRDVGGFELNIKGAQEDMDLAYRIKAAGWLSYVTDSIFYHRQCKTWKELWRRHFWYGYGLHFLLAKNKRLNIFRDRSVDRIALSFLAYKLTHRKAVFLLPLNFIFKKTALFFGFVRAHLDGYGHKLQGSS
jgi:cellulose synthase/poly-beta-1,6-N-acetylglucosamine synthase-like glycosyltransferase